MFLFEIHIFGKGSWKKWDVGNFEVRKFRFKLESINRSWKVSNAILSTIKNFPSSARIFQLHSFQFNFELSNLKDSKFSFFPSCLSNYICPSYPNMVWREYPVTLRHGDAIETNETAMWIALVTLVALTREVQIRTDNTQTFGPHLTQITLKSQTILFV